MEQIEEQRYLLVLSLQESMFMHGVLNITVFCYLKLIVLTHFGLVVKVLGYYQMVCRGDTVYSNNKKKIIVSSSNMLCVISLHSGYLSTQHEDRTVNDLNKLTGVNATRLVRAYDVIAKLNADSQNMTKIIGLLKFHCWVLLVSSVIDATRVNLDVM